MKKPFLESVFFYGLKLESMRQQISRFLPLPETISAIRDIPIVPKEVCEATGRIENSVRAIPDPSQEDAARDYLIVCQERMETYRSVLLHYKEVQERAELTRIVSGVYATTSDEVLKGVYEEVEKDFSELYRYINRDDEGNFEAKLVPSMGKLGFDVDFYGRGFFPPGAYHSEGHQDGMGLCLYLALMKHLLGDEFTFAVLDDVLMSVDSGHRREVCTLLKDRFPNTQFIITTHDAIWLRHMRTAGIISSEGCVHFRKWDVDHGPTEWGDLNIWDEIANEQDVRAAAALLRHYLEYISLEACHKLRAQVELRGDAQYQLGDLMPNAAAQMRGLLKRGKQATQSWGKVEELDMITARETKFASLVGAAYIDQWQINPAVHYNEWVNLNVQDFFPVVESFKKLVDSFFCSECGSLFYVMPERGEYETLRCACTRVNINLKVKPH